MRKLILSLALLASGVLLAGCQQLLDYKAKSGLQVITDEIPSSVFLNGQYLNSTPLIEKDLQPGEYTLKIQPNDPALLPYETSIILRKGLLTVATWKPAEKTEMSGGVIYEMEPLKDSSKTEISFVSIPEGAIVALEEREKDFTPVVYTDVAPGNRSFEVTLPSYETQNHTINVQPGYRMLVRIKLAKLQAIEETKPIISPAPVTTTSSNLNQAQAATGSTLNATNSAATRQ